MVNGWIRGEVKSLVVGALNGQEREAERKMVRRFERNAPNQVETRDKKEFLKWFPELSELIFAHFDIIEISIKVRKRDGRGIMKLTYKN